MALFNKPDSVIATDASFGGAGGWSGQEYFRFQWSEDHRELGTNLAIREMKAFIAGLKVWGSTLTGKNIVCNVDNESVCMVINKGHSRILELQDGMREVAYLVAINNFELFMVHLEGKKI